METRKEEIVKYSAKLFKNKGYSAVTMRDIAESLDIKAASLYNHISSKQEILNCIIISLAESFTEGIKKIKQSDDNSIQKLEQIIALHISITRSNQFGMASLNNDWMHLQDELNYYLKMRKNYENTLKTIIKEGVNANELKDEDIEIMLFSILSTLRSLYLWTNQFKDMSELQINKKLSNVLLQGIIK